MAFKCRECAAAWVHGVALSAEQWGQRPASGWVHRLFPVEATLWARDMAGVVRNG